MATPTLPEVQAYVISAGQTFADTDVADALAAEIAAQSRVCRVGNPMEDDLAQSLKRRVLRNLAMRAIALGVMSDDVGSTVIGSNDAEVRRYEKPFRKVICG